MKLFTLIICLSLLSAAGTKAQGLTPSTVRQIFSLQKGDSLEYHVWNVGACSPQCNYYILRLVESVSYISAQDTMSIFFQTQILHFDSSGPPVSGASCGQCHTYFMIGDICAISADLWRIPYLDSTITFCLDTTYRSGYGWIYDSIYRNPSLYNGTRQNFYYYSGMNFQGTTDVYADSIGIVYKAENVELGSNNREQLIYYHKANGGRWGTPFINTGIGDVGEEYPVSVYPNPAQGRFIVKTDRNKGVELDLYNVLSEKVMNRALTERETEMEIKGMAPGIYYWQLRDASTVVKGGKLILE